ncbi:MAG TPA: hypothetical protein PJ982_14695 [Lacipirellulaceae bacterium]|nr:hypothetical protein [Lacipirellulaceae bacterium]
MSNSNEFIFRIEDGGESPPRSQPSVDRGAAPDVARNRPDIYQIDPLLEKALFDYGIRRPTGQGDAGGGQPRIAGNLTADAPVLNENRPDPAGKLTADAPVINENRPDPAGKKKKKGKGEDEEEEGEELTKFREKVESMTGTFGKVADYTKQLAGNDGFGALTSGLVDAAATLAGPWGIAVKGAAAGLTMFKEVIDSFLVRADQLAKYSPDIAMSQSVSQLREQRFDMIESTSRMWNDVKEILLPIKKIVVEALSGFMEAAAEVFAIFKGLVDFVFTVIGPAVDLVVGIIKAVYKYIKMLYLLVRRWFQWMTDKEEEKKLTDAAIDDLWKLADSVVKNGGGRPADRGVVGAGRVGSAFSASPAMGF